MVVNNYISGLKEVDAEELRVWVGEKKKENRKN